MKYEGGQMILFVCFEVLRPIQPAGVMSSTVSLPNHTFSWAGLNLVMVNQYLCTFFCKKQNILYTDSESPD